MKGIGASARGVEAFDAFFRAMPDDSGMASVLPPHPDPQHVSLLPELLQRHTKLELPFCLWTREAAEQLIERRFGVRLSVWTVGRYLKRWGIRCKRRKHLRTLQIWGRMRIEADRGWAVL